MRPGKGTTMNRKRVRAIHIPRSCSRCHRQLRNNTLLNSKAVIPRGTGKVTATVCADCLTLSECAELVMQEVSTESALNIQDGLIYKHQLGTPDDAWTVA
jgi:hypothetical protein